MPTNGLSFDTIPDSVTQRALAHNYSIEEKSRRSEMLLNKDFYYGKQEQQLVLVNEDVEPAIINLTKPIVTKRAGMLYKRKVVRDMEGPSESIEFLEQVYKENKIDMFMKHVDLLSELTGSVLVHPSSIDDPKYPSGIKLMSYDASQFSAVSEDNDSSEAAAISLVKEVTRLSSRSTPQNPQVERVLRQQVWTKEAVVTYNGLLSQGTHQQQLMKSETTSLGYLPFLNIRSELVQDQYLGHAPTTSLRKLNEVVNQTLTHLLHIIKMQGFTPIAVSGYASGEGVTIHPGRAFSLPAGAAASVLSTDPKIKEMLDTIRFLEEKAFETNSVPKVAVVGGEGESGRELMVRFFPLLQVFNSKSVLFSAYELDLANLILKIVGLPPIEFINVNYPEEDLLPLSSEEDSLDQDLRLNIRTAVDELMRRDPDLTEDEAEVIIRANKDFNTEIGVHGKEVTQSGAGSNQQQKQQSSTGDSSPSSKKKKKLEEE